MRPLHRLSLLPALLLILTACAALGLEEPRDLPDRIAYVTSGADAVVVSATNALNAHAISSGDAQYVSTAGRQLSALAAAAAADPDPKSAEGRLALAEGVLRQLKAYLATKQVKS
jgi:hypothetical protein